MLAKENIVISTSLYGTNLNSCFLARELLNKSGCNRLRAGIFHSKTLSDWNSYSILIT